MQPSQVEEAVDTKTHEHIAENMISSKLLAAGMLVAAERSSHR